MENEVEKHTVLISSLEDDDAEFLDLLATFGEGFIDMSIFNIMLVDDINATQGVDN